MDLTWVCNYGHGVALLNPIYFIVIAFEYFELCTLGSDHIIYYYIVDYLFSSFVQFLQSQKISDPDHYIYIYLLGYV